MEDIYAYDTKLCFAANCANKFDLNIYSSFQPRFKGISIPLLTTINSNETKNKTRSIRDQIIN